MFELAQAIKSEARRLGFDRVGIASSEPSGYRDYFRRWLDDGKGGAMEYLNARFAERVDPAVYFPGCASVICVAMNYYHPLEAPREGHHGRVARYALGDDYHEVIKPRLHRLADWVRRRVPDSQSRCAVDTAPVMEKELAARAGVGWLGKNTCIINAETGSWLLLGEVLTTLKLPPDAPATDRCGTCTRCIDACPTQAISEPYRLDATRCISYLTIEQAGEIDLPLNDWLYGCDICQEVCPWNRRAVASLEAAFEPRFAGGTIDLNELETWSAEDYQRRLRGSAMKRVKLPVLQRNGRLVAAQKKAGAAATAAAPRG
jgi:epoxyqueuosine reductase